MLARVFEEREALPHPALIRRPNLHIAELDHWFPSGLDGCGYPSEQREVNLE
jgi:hypothetical protein